jgi:hypothetical protein
MTSFTASGVQWKEGKDTDNAERQLELYSNQEIPQLHA